MARLPKIPLAERLQNAGTSAPNFLAAFELFTADYYAELEQITGDPYFGGIFRGYICEYCRIPKAGEEDTMTELLLSEVVAAAERLPRDKRADLLYKLLVEPFAILYDKEKESAA